MSRKKSIVGHYIYAFIDPCDGVVRYVGQGVARRYRWWKNDRRRRDLQYGVHDWLHCLERKGLEPEVVIVLEQLTADQADDWEIGLINLIGRKSDGTGTLLNSSSGGRKKGLGCKRSPNMRLQMSGSNRNTATRKMPKNKYFGIRLVKKTGRWQAQIQVVGKNHHLGYYTTDVEAAYAYNVAVAVILDGEGRFNPVFDLLEPCVRENIEKKVLALLDKHPQAPEFQQRLPHEACAKCPVRKM